MSERRPTIGYNRTVRLRWLDFTAELTATGQSEADIIAALQEYLRNELSVGSKAKRGSREKTITILLKTWIRVRPSLRAFRDRAIGLLATYKSSDRLALHWGMTIAAYPFFGTVAEVVGRLLRLQKQFTASQVHRRIRELFGERETVSRSTRYVLRAFVDWGILKEGSKIGVYTQGRRVSVSDSNVAVCLLAAILYLSTNGAPSLRSLLGSPALFPFALQQVRLDSLDTAAHLEIICRGPGNDLVLLPKPKLRNVKERAHRN